MITFDQIRKNETINTYIHKDAEAQIELGYTECRFAHVGTVAIYLDKLFNHMG